MKHSVITYRSAGLEAKWSKTRSGTPAVFVRNPKSAHAHQRDSWWIATKSMFERMNKVGVLEGFDQETLLGDIFSIRA